MVAALAHRFPPGALGVRSIAFETDKYLEKPRSLAVLCATFAALGIALNVTGLYALSRFEVNRRQREFAIRLALGARPIRLQLNAIISLAIPVLLGTALGVTATIIGARFLTGTIFERQEITSLSVGVAVLLVVASSGLAMLAPARFLITRPLMPWLRS
jgi:hypothetical protein